MEQFDYRTDIVLLLDSFENDAYRLFQSFEAVKSNICVVIVEDSGFLPEGMTSVYRFFIDRAGYENREGKIPKFFDQITVPDYWEISSTYTQGKVQNLDKERARIFYSEPTNKRLVKEVDWLNEKGIVRSSDMYDKYGNLYARIIYNKSGQKVYKTYFSEAGVPIIEENFVTEDILVNEKSETKIFHGKVGFINYFLKCAGLDQAAIFYNSLSLPHFVSYYAEDKSKNDILFWQEKARDDIPGNMKLIFEGNQRTKKIVVQNRKAYEKLIELGAPKDMLIPMGYIYPFEKETAYSKNVLICTNSDQIANLQELVESLPDCIFHIAAITEMSSKLLDMGKNKNVCLYPGVKEGMLEKLWKKCDLYLDINYANEIASAISKAFLNHMLILGFFDTLHNDEFVAPEHRFALENVSGMVDLLNKIINDQEIWGKHLKIQENHAMAQEAKSYSELLGAY